MKQLLILLMLFFSGCITEKKFDEYNMQFQNTMYDYLYIEGFRGENIEAPYIGYVLKKEEYINFIFANTQNPNLNSTHHNSVKSIKVYTSNTCDYKLLFEYTNMDLIATNIETFNRNNKALQLILRISSGSVDYRVKNLNKKGTHEWHSKSLEERCKI
jgi:hypothetical protein